MQILLDSINSMYPLSEALQQELIRHLKHQLLRKKEYWLKAGQVSRKVCFIESGMLRAFYIKDNKEITTWFLKEGDATISMESFFNQEPSRETIQALENTNIYYITYDELQALYKLPEFNALGRIVFERHYQIANDQYQALKALSAAERYQWLLENRPEIVLRVPAKYIASYIGVTEVTLSRIRGQK